MIVTLPPHREVYLLQQVPGVRYHARTDAHHPGGHFVLPLTWAACVGLRGVFGTRLEIGPELAAWAREELRARVRPAMSLRETLELPPEHPRPDFFEGLRPYQEVVAALMSVAGSVINADEMRLGKTVETIVGLRLLGDALPALVIVPNSAKFQWVSEFERWWPEVRPVIVRGSAKQRREALARVSAGDADVAVINWEALRLHSKLTGYGSVVALARCRSHGGRSGAVPDHRCEAHPRELNEITWGSVVADEAHRAVHPRTKQTRALWAVGWAAPHRFALTGTPILNSPEDLWALGRWVAPDEWPSKTAFVERYGQTGWNVAGHLEVIGLRHDTKDELFSFLDPRFVRRTREQVMPWLPPKIYTERTVEMTTKQQRAYTQMKREMLAELDDDQLTYVTNPLAKLTRLRQFACAYAEVTPEGLRLTTPSCKVDALLEVVEELGEKSAVVFSESKQLLYLAGAALEKQYSQLGYVTGDVTDTERDRTVRLFQRGDLQFLLVTLGAGGESLTLDRADVAVFIQRPFSLVKSRQAEDRIVGRPGPGYEIIDVVTADSVEQRVFEVLGEKGELFEQVVRDRGQFRELVE